MIPMSGQVSRGDDSFSGGGGGGQIYRFFSDVPPGGGDARDLVEILQAGDNKSIPVRIVTPEWLAANPAAALIHDAWKRGRSVESGMPLDAWAGVDRGMVASCAVYSIYTVEQLAAVDDERLMRLGIGARDLRSRARLFLESRADAAAVARVQAEKDRMEAQLSAQAAQMRDMQAQMSAFMRARENPAPVAEHAAAAPEIAVPPPVAQAADAQAVKPSAPKARA